MSNLTATIPVAMSDAAPVPLKEQLRRAERM